VRKSASDALGRQEIPEKPATPDPQSVPTERQRGLTQRIKKQETQYENDGLTDELKNRWSRVRQALPHLKPIPYAVHQRLLRTHAVHRRFKQPAIVVKEIDKEFSQYSNIKESAFVDVSIRLVFDNEVSRGGRKIPATRQLEVIIVSQDNQYFIFLNTTYIEHYW
jgi:hypothetical protein